MTQILEATYDGTVLRFKEQLHLAPNTTVRVTIETIDSPTSGDFIAACLAADLDGPEDWSENLEHYLYGGDDNASK